MSTEVSRSLEKGNMEVILTLGTAFIPHGICQFNVAACKLIMAATIINRGIKIPDTR